MYICVCIHVCGSTVVGFFFKGNSMILERRNNIKINPRCFQGGRLQSAHTTGQYDILRGWCRWKRCLRELTAPQRNNIKSVRGWTTHAEEVKNTVKDQLGCQKPFLNLRGEWSIQKREAGSGYFGELQSFSLIMQTWNQKMKAAISKRYWE